ncbi:RNA polymerase sigma-70 factor [Ancylomarina sp. 16SWW S1-10-2]|uniref:RNA polymerase sigma-70 factor n=1 Tax=Ancylomarina sp. 16SWW S1-10-2 TaxID=2499681 RepID=UPI0012ADBD8D|nr:RNA polymerase sigma-70 factor [Ancylomarina sp. 16SWW S1-10-2]MRT94728.1 RNA polymerase sigma-70 factor [Ancylomarina sp. 16SWW S1-10-2]
MLSPKDFKSFRKGDRKAFKLIFDTFHKPLIIFATKYVNDADLAEDLVQEIFVKLWEKRKTIENSITIKAFLFTSVKNRALNHFRHLKVVDVHQKEMIQSKSEESFFKNHLIEEETYRLLIQAIHSLPDQTRKVCTLSMNGVKNAQIAEELNLSTSTVKYHKNKAITILRAKLKDHLFLLPLLPFFFDL